MCTEFFEQGDLEAKLKLPVTPFMDRKTASVPKQQIGFYNFIVRPMYETMDRLVSMEVAARSVQATFVPNFYVKGSRHR